MVPYFFNQNFNVKGKTLLSDEGLCNRFQLTIISKNLFYGINQNWKLFYIPVMLLNSVHKDGSHI